MSGNQSEQTSPGADEDIWGQASSHDSAFQDPPLVVEVDEGEAQQAASQAPAAADSKVKGKPNYVILGLAGVIGLTVLGAGAVLGYKRFATPERITQAPAIPSQVFDGGVATPGASGANAATSDVLNTAGAVAASGSGVFETSVPSSHSASFAQSPLDTAAAATSAPAFASASASASSALNVPASLGQAGTPGVSAPDAVAQEVLANGTPRRDLPVAQATSEDKVANSGTAQATSGQAKAKVKKSAASRSAKSAGEARQPRTPVRMARSQGHRAKSTRKPVLAASKPAVVQQGGESVVLPDVRVVGVYPLTGKDAQAWLRSSKGATTIVRQGDVVHGMTILDVVAEQGQVKTSLGLLSSKGFVR